jgi:small subunit ribosomal protein S6
MTESYLPLPRSHRGPERSSPGPEEVHAAMRPYEVMVIFDVDLDEAEIRERLERLNEVVRSHGGTPGSVNHWGRRTLAYEIKHRPDGYYVVVEATAEPVAMFEVDRFLALDDGVLRHKVIRQPPHVAGRGSDAWHHRSGHSQGRPTDAGVPAADRRGAEAAEPAPAPPVGGDNPGGGEVGPKEAPDESDGRHEGGEAGQIAAEAAEISGTDAADTQAAGPAS